MGDNVKPFLNLFMKERCLIKKNYTVLKNQKIGTVLKNYGTISTRKGKTIMEKEREKEKVKTRKEGK